MDPTSNYTGMFLSDGHFQQSVMFGRTTPKGPVDAQSRLHDTAYAFHKSRKYRRAADHIYDERMPNTLYGRTAGNMVHYGNHLLNAISGITKPWNGYDSVYDELFDGDDWSARQAVLNLYDFDPTATKVNYTPITNPRTTTNLNAHPDTGGGQSGNYGKQTPIIPDTGAGQSGDYTVVEPALPPIIEGAVPTPNKTTPSQPTGMAGLPTILQKKINDANAAKDPRMQLRMLA